MTKYSVDCLIIYTGQEVDDLKSTNFYLPQLTCDMTWRKLWESKNDKVGWLRFTLVTDSRTLESAKDYALTFMTKVGHDESVRPKLCEVLRVFNETEGKWEETEDDC